MPVENPGGGGGESAAYKLVGALRTERVASDGTFQPVVVVTAQSVTYGVQFTFTVAAKTWDTDGGPPLIGERTAQVDYICSREHTIDFRTEQDQGPSQVLYNYAVITVGTPDGAISDEVRVRMDQLDTEHTFALLDAAWHRLAAAGAQ